MASHRPTRIGILILFTILGAYSFWEVTPLRAQSTTATGSIQGTITDPSGEVTSHLLISRSIGQMVYWDFIHPLSTQSGVARIT